MYTLQGETTAKEVFENTVKKEIPSPVINNNPIYRNGCYVFLTSDEGDQDKQITWGNEDE